MSVFLRGAFSYFRGIQFWLAHKSLLGLSIIPFFLDFIALLAGMTFAFLKLPLVMGHLMSHPKFWYMYIVYYLVYALTALTLFFLTLLFVFILANLISFPFNSLLTERALRVCHERRKIIEGGVANPDLKKERMFGYSTVNTLAMVQKTIIYLVVVLFLAVISLIPGFGIIAAAMGVLLLGYELMDYSFDTEHWKFKRRLSFIKEHLAEFAGWSLGLGLTTAIPVVNIFIFPGSVVAAAFLFHEIQSREHVGKLQNGRIG